MSDHIDIAVNLIGSALESNLDTVVAEAEAAGVSPLIVIGSSLAESRQAIEACQGYPGKLYATAGVHPHHASSWNESSYDENRALCANTCVVAVGECGLDYNRDFSPRDKQREAFAAQLKLAVELQLPVLMHERDAHADFLAILKEYRPHLVDAVLHCFTGNRESLEAYLQQDIYLGITGWVCDERRGQELAEIVPLIPDDRIMIETDSPYLLPRSMRPKPKSSKNLPKYLPYIAEYIAGLRRQQPDQFAARTLANSRRFFRLDALP
ncbi:TatD family hydrolase [Shewanella corallii]|uniref:TatD family hydrolase n=1 Tax=Shewanella corallii TaxID=560080 RepID=A0ABT0N187_9GAMM|nr:TatD family hydrolase [Shewanella corallii]MCL2912204.1 TatD family hydrolase [Shewanella corallii]